MISLTVRYFTGVKSRNNSVREKLLITWMDKKVENEKMKISQEYGENTRPFHVIKFCKIGSTE